MSWIAYIAMLIPPAIAVITHRTSFIELGYSKKNVAKQILIGVAISIIIFVISVIIPLVLRADKLESPAPSFGTLILEIFASFTVVGFAEEFVFRGYFYSKITLLTGSELAAVILSSILFGIWHYPANFSVRQAVSATLVGLAFGFARYKIKNCSVMSVSIAHWLLDSAILVASFVLLSPK